MIELWLVFHWDWNSNWSFYSGNTEIEIAVLSWMLQLLILKLILKQLSWHFCNWFCSGISVLKLLKSYRPKNFRIVQRCSEAFLIVFQFWNKNVAIKIKSIRPANGIINCFCLRNCLFSFGGLRHLAWLEYQNVCNDLTKEHWRNTDDAFLLLRELLSHDCLATAVIFYIFCPLQVV